MLQIAVRPSSQAAPAARYSRSACPLDAMFRKERAGLLRYLAKRVGPELAHDLVQDIFMRAATSPQILSVDNPSAYLRKIAQNLMIDGARRQRCKIVTVTSDHGAEYRSPADQEFQLEADELKHALFSALAQLPERTRAIFVMHRFEEKAYREIQTEVGISQAGVEYHMMKALAHVRLCLGDHMTGRATNITDHKQK